MPSYAAAPEERPVTVSGDPPPSGDQPPRQLAKRKNAPGGGRPPNPICCGKPTRRLTTGSGTTMCETCETVYPPGTTTALIAASSAAAAKVNAKPPSVLGAGLGGKESERIRQDLAAAQDEIRPLAHSDNFASPGLNGDHATRAEERSKIPPSRPANNSRGPRGAAPRYEIRTTPPPPSIGLRRNTGLAEAVRDLPTDGSAWLCLPPDDLTAARVRDTVRRLKVRSRIFDVTHYLAADRSCRVVIRIANAQAEARS